MCGWLLWIFCALMSNWRNRCFSDMILFWRQTLLSCSFYSCCNVLTLAGFTSVGLLRYMSCMSLCGFQACEYDFSSWKTNVAMNCLFAVCWMQVFMRNPLQEFYPPPAERNCTYSNDSAPVVHLMAAINTSELVTWVPSSVPSNESTFSFDNVTCAPPLFRKYGYPNTALLSVILTGGTFLLAFLLKKFRNSKFLGRNVSICYMTVIPSCCVVLLTFSRYHAFTNHFFLKPFLKCL